MSTGKNDADGVQNDPIFVTALPSYGTETVTMDETVPVAAAEVTPLIEVQKDISPKCQDLPFAIIFLIHLVIMIWLGVAYAPAGYENITINVNFTAIEDEIRKSDNVTEEDIRQIEAFATEVAKYVQVYPLRIVLYLVLPCFILSYIIAFVTTAFVIKPCTKPAVYSSLIGSVVWTSLVMIGSSIGSNTVPVYVLTGLSIAAVVYYVTIAWKMVPFAAVNLKVALEGISRNCGMYLLAFCGSWIGFFWVFYWFYVVIGVSGYKNTECRKAHPDSNFDISSEDYDDVCDPPPVAFLLFLLSLYWTSTVMMNTVQVTVAGVMATWCFDKKEADNCCSPAVFLSLFRSLTYSFGSICLGSLLQALISVFRFIVEQARNQRDREDSCEGCGALLLCILECLARLLEDIIEYFNQWAYVFVGIYGYSYLESGRRVMELFRARGWTSIITNNLVGYVLAFTTFTVGIITGGVAVLVESLVSRHLQDPNSQYESFVFGPVPGYRWWSFGIGVLIGVWISAIMTNVVKGAVNTLVVCWADSPAVLEMQHPALTKEMAESWTAVFPEANVQVRPAYSSVVV